MRIIITIITFVLTIAVTPAQSHGIYKMPPFERAVCCIKFFEGLHQAKDYPYIGYGHRILPGEKLTYPITEHQADSILRSDLRKNCALFRKYGADSLLLGCISYNCGCASLLGSKKKPRSIVLKKLEVGNRDILLDLLDFCHYKGKRHPYIQRRRWMEYLLLFEK